MNNFLKPILTFLLVLAALFIFNKFGPPFSFNSVVTQKTDLFTVSGEGKVTVVPDIGVVNLGISLTRPSVKSAQTEVNNIINKISADTKSLGVDAKDIQTRNYSIYPEYDYRSDTGRKITGYRVSASLTVKVRDLEKINQVIDTATANEANTISGISLTVDETKEKELLRQAREEAIKEAKTKAESLARAAGITLGRIVNVQESGSPVSPTYYRAAFDSIAMEGGGETKIEPGSTDISSTVTLYYETR